MNRILWGAVAGLLGVALVGCSAGAPAAQQSGATPGFVGSPKDISDAAAAVRADAALPTPIARVKITSGQNWGNRKPSAGFFVVYAVTAGASATVLQYGIERAPGGKDVDVPDVGRENEPALVVGPTSFHAIRWYDERSRSKEADSGALRAQPWSVHAPARSSLAVLYPALPANTSQVSITSPLFGSVSVPVARPAVPKGTAAVPIRGRVTYQSPNSATFTEPLTVSIHSVRRVAQGTAIYYSVAFPAGEQQGKGSSLPLTPFGGASGLLSHITTYRSFTSSFGLIDRSSMKAYSQLTEGVSLKPPTIVSSEHGLEEGLAAGSVMAGVAIMPELPAGASTVDVVVGVNQFILDVPVEQGAVGAPDGSTQTVLGQAWPSFDQKVVTSLAAKDPQDRVWGLFDRVSEESVTSGGNTLDLDANVLFAFNKATLTPKAQQVIAKAVEKIKSSGRTGKVTVTGYTDNVGSTSFNLALSRKRAEAVVSQLRAALPTGYEFTAIGKGEANPVGSNTTAAGRALNRRVEVMLP